MSVRKQPAKNKAKLICTFNKEGVCDKRRKAQFLVRDWAVFFGQKPMMITDTVSDGQSSVDRCRTGDWHQSQMMGTHGI